MLITLPKCYASAEGLDSANISKNNEATMKRSQVSFHAASVGFSSGRG